MKSENETIDILIVDDEQSFLKATEGLLRQEGYRCTCATSGPGALDELNKASFDLVIADINMPGNAQLEFVRELESLAPCTPVVLVTGYPSVKTAVESLHLPVIAYLLKPFDYEELLRHIRSGISHGRALAAICESRRHLEEYRVALSNIEKTVNAHPPRSATDPTRGLLASRLKHIYDALSDIHRLTVDIEGRNGEPTRCDIADCPPRIALLATLRHAVEVIRDTRTAFKSKQLERLREELEQAIADASGESSA